MISKVEIAKNVSDLLVEVTGLLNESAKAVIESDIPEEEKKRYLKTVGIVMGEIGVEVLNKLYYAHPELLPDGYYLPGVSSKNG